MDFLARLLSGGLTALQFHFFRFWRHWLTVAGGTLLFLIGISIVVRAPMNFRATTIEIQQGDSAPVVAQRLVDAHLIMSKTALLFALRLCGGDDQVHAGTYLFDSPENMLSVARRLVTADYGVPAVRMTFVEGFTVREAALQVAAAFPEISVKEFTTAAELYEGYLFPDTYVFPPSMSATSMVGMMRTNFTTRTATLERSGAAATHSLKDIVTMASLIEKEARTEESRRMVSGVLWNRIGRDMPLQVDAVFGYIFQRETYSPSPSDLKVDSPYNTYTQRGLPPGPIGNPGLRALTAAANPTKTSYLYYLTGNDNLMHYATTYVGHKNNLQKYLQ